VGRRDDRLLRKIGKRPSQNPSSNLRETDLSPDKHGFRCIREDDVTGQHCSALELLPRRNDMYLLCGNVWIDVSTYLPRRFEGELAKAPWWWVRNVRVVLVYGNVGGMWLQTASEASANVRILGSSTMVSHDVRYKLNEVATRRGHSAAAPTRPTY
jgi:hypothetical protein